MATPTTKTELLKSQDKELVKQYIVYDGSSRPESVYTAVSTAITGTPCTLTTYAYDGISTRITKRRESYSSWDSSWDIT